MIRMCQVDCSGMECRVGAVVPRSPGCFHDCVEGLESTRGAVREPGCSPRHRENATHMRTPCANTQSRVYCKPLGSTAGVLELIASFPQWKRCSSSPWWRTRTGDDDGPVSKIRGTRWQQV